MKFLKIFLFFILIFSLLFTISCGNQKSRLSREAAKKIIVKAYEFPKPIFLLIAPGEYTEVFSWEMWGYPMETSKDFLWSFLRNDVQYKFLKETLDDSLGIIEFSPDINAITLRKIKQQFIDVMQATFKYEIRLTEKGTRGATKIAENYPVTEGFGSMGNRVYFNAIEPRESRLFGLKLFDIDLLEISGIRPTNDNTAV